MLILGCDFHPSWQQVSWLDTETGETGEHKLVHSEGEAQRFYGQLAAPVLIGMEATGNSQWFIELVEDLGHEIWIGDAAQIRASYVRKQKTDKRDAAGCPIQAPLWLGWGKFLERKSPPYENRVGWGTRLCIVIMALVSCISFPPVVSGVIQRRW